MEWHLTWQDPVAIAAFIGAIFFARWLRRRATPTACEACAQKVSGKPSARRPMPPTVVGLERLRLGRSSGRR